MNRKILLIEPNYKNKYPPMGLMKLATYYRNQGDDVRFFKGDLKYFAAQILCENFLKKANSPKLGKYVPKLIQYIKTGKYASLDSIPNFRDSEFFDLIKNYRIKYRYHDYPKFDVIAITTLFTFYWKKTIETINFSKQFCHNDSKLFVGGIAASILYDKVEAETGIKPICGLLNVPGILDPGNDCIIDELPLDYSILEEIDYNYPANNAYFAYMTRGCIRKCAFCAVPKLEPDYKEYISLKQQLLQTDERFGPQKDLLLLDNNVFASSKFDQIIDEIKECGFGKGAKYSTVNEYDITINNIKSNYNERAYIKKMIRLYDAISHKLTEAEQADFYLERENRNLLYSEVATCEAVLDFDEYVKPLYDKDFKSTRRKRIIDFNQGVDARLVTDEMMKKLSEVNIYPLRIAFDHYSMKSTYELAIRTAAKHGIKSLSNYLLYNYTDTPDELYYRMKINIDLCLELDVTIYSFPMKYHPIDDPEFFQNRNFIGKHWNRKFIRSIQAILNSTKGKVGRGKSFFEEAFGSDINEYHKILWMPEKFIIHRMKYKNSLTAEWWEKYSKLDNKQLELFERIVSLNKFDSDSIKTIDQTVNDILSYYQPN